MGWNGSFYYIGDENKNKFYNVQPPAPSLRLLPDSFPEPADLIASLSCHPIFENWLQIQAMDALLECRALAALSSKERKKPKQMLQVLDRRWGRASIRHDVRFCKSWHSVSTILIKKRQLPMRSANSTQWSLQETIQTTHQLELVTWRKVNMIDWCIKSKGQHGNHCPMHSSSMRLLNYQIPKPNSTQMITSRSNYSEM